jgi:hypothetical protein
MKKILFVLVVFALQSLARPLPAGGADFLGAPLPEGGRMIVETGRRTQAVYQESLQAVSDFYRRSFKDKDADLKFKEKPGRLRIEDFGNQRWHAIVIEEQADHSVSVTVTKDSWGWLLTTLALRFLGVFVVLMVLLIAVSAAAAVITRLSPAQETKA